MFILENKKENVYKASTTVTHVGNQSMLPVINILQLIEF